MKSSVEQTLRIVCKQLTLRLSSEASFLEATAGANAREENLKVLKENLKALEDKFKAMERKSRSVVVRAKKERNESATDGVNAAASAETIVMLERI